MTGDVRVSVVTGVRDSGGAEESVQPESRRAVCCQKEDDEYCSFHAERLEGLLYYRLFSVHIGSFVPISVYDVGAGGGVIFMDFCSA